MENKSFFFFFLNIFILSLETIKINRELFSIINFNCNLFMKVKMNKIDNAMHLLKDEMFKDLYLSIIKQTKETGYKSELNI